MLVVHLVVRVALGAVAGVAFCRTVGATPGNSPVLLPPPPALPQTYLGVAVLMTEATFAEPAERMARALVDELAEFDGVRVISPTRLREELTRAKLPTLRCDDVPCSARMARYVGAHYAVASALTEGRLRVWLYETEGGQLLGYAERVLPAERVARAQALRGALAQLMSPQQFVGALDVQTEGAGVAVYVDGRWMGETPLAAPLEGLTVGLHRVQLVPPAQEPVQRLVEVGFDTVSRVSLARGARVMAVTRLDSVADGAASGTLSLAELPRDVEVRVDGALRAVTSLVSSDVRVRAGWRKVSLRKAGLEGAALRVEVHPGRVHVLGARRVDNRLSVEVRRVVSQRRAGPELGVVDAMTVFLQRTDAFAERKLAFKFPWLGTLYGARAAKVAAAGFLTREIGRLRTPPIRPPESRSAMLMRERERALGGAEVRGRSFEFETWHWVGLGAGVALIATGTSLLMYDALNGGDLPRVFQAQRFDIPGFTGLRVTFRDDFARITVRGQW